MAMKTNQYFPVLISSGEGEGVILAELYKEGGTWNENNVTLIVGRKILII